MKLDEFCRSLNEHTTTRGDVPLPTVVELLDQLEITRAEVEDCVRFDDEHYKRTVLRLGHGWAALVLCWQPGQASPIHDHRGSACGVLVLEGAITETQFRRGDDGMLVETGTNVLSCGNVCGSYDCDIHEIRNAESGDLITLHLYTPPLKDFHLYSLDSSEIETVSDRATLEAQRALAGR